MNAMLEVPVASPAAHPSTPFDASAARTYSGPERRRRDAAAPGLPAAHWLTLMLEEVGHGMLLVGDEAEVLHANHLARRDLDASHPLQLQGHRLQARDARDEAHLRQALQAAARGLRRLIVVGTGTARSSVAVVPLAPVEGSALTLVSLGRRRLGEELALQCFARSHGLTSAETRVLEGLCSGIGPGAIAALHRVGMATVRTQISSIRHKIGASDITSLMRLVAQLPPMVPALRQGFAAGDGANDGLRLSA
ncbi:DNA-binding CsgD family transcriptional regulator [Rubrivivax sp. A210]|uniref:helix-turn-helix transcriptional regulator n=1 Tax=Rubrivivax sp. A210 TaxID=2772301 RepID=UPI001919BC83|nr:helix-turn-helix transcriptional regulator [Rubrivivax sp. A210]CAD5373436.1 DNA-binding CsgD family transcriptional regulator [Rubrivivax sp. A210]